MTLPAPPPVAAAPDAPRAFRAVWGVDFSGARLAGRTTWVARLEPTGGDPAFALTLLKPVEKLCGTAERKVALTALTELIARSSGCLWGLGFPFAFPAEVAGPFPGQLELVNGWGDDAYALGLELVRRTEILCGKKHLRRLTDLETRAPHDPYHYRLIYQTFFGLRDVLGPLLCVPGTAVLPFGYDSLPGAERVVVEALPAATLDRLGLPRWNYKRPQGPLGPRELANRREILKGLSGHMGVSVHRRRVLLSDPGGDALDAVLAALGSARGYAAADHRAAAGNPRYRLEGLHFA